MFKQSEWYTNPRACRNELHWPDYARLSCVSVISRCHDKVSQRMQREEGLILADDPFWNHAEWIRAPLHETYGGAKTHPWQRGGMDGGGVSYEHTSQISRLSVLPLPARPPLHVTCSYELLIDEFSLPLPSTHSSFIYQQYLAAETHTLDSEAFWDISSPPKTPWLPLLLSGDTTDRAFQSLELKLPLPWKPAHDLSFLISNDDKTTLDCSLWDVAGGNIQEHAGTSPATSQRYTGLQGLQPRRMLCSAFYLEGFVQSTLGKMFGKC